MDKQYYIADLAIEITRRCNMRCAHCLRGNAQSVGITEKIIDELLKHVSGIGTLTITGGEPSLGIPKMQYLLDAIKENNIPVYSFFVATNGKENVRSLLQVTDQLYEYCYICSESIDTIRICNSKAARYELDITGDRFDENCGSIALSSDKYHDPIPKVNAALLMSRRYFSSSKIMQDTYIIPEGRGAQLSTNKRAKYNFIDHLDMFDDDQIDTLYVNVYGKLLTDCNYSYESQEDLQFGDVWTFDESIQNKYQEGLKDEH